MFIRRLSATTFVLPLLFIAACSSDEETTQPDAPGAAGTSGETQNPDGTAGTSGELSGGGGEGQDPNLPLESDPAALTGIEAPGNGCPLVPMPEFDALPENPEFPNPFVMGDGQAVTTKAQWACRHRELRNMFEKYETGPKTDAPAEVTGSVADYVAPPVAEGAMAPQGPAPNSTLTVNISDGAGKTATFNVNITYPTTGSAPYPAMIGLNGGSLNRTRLAEQGVALINFQVNDVRPENDRSAGAFTNFTGSQDTGSLMAWAWGVSRVIDALEATPDANIKADRLGITGCSRLGKGALMVGAMDSRLALTIPQESGSGGAAAWRAAEYENETAPQGCETPTDLTRCVQKLSSTYTEQQWFGTSIAQFSGAVNKLPVDHHELIAMGAPRGMLALGNIGWRWLGRYGSVQGMNGARQVYQALGVTDNIGFVESGHNHCNNTDFTGQEQQAVDAFVAKFLLDQDVSTTFWDEGGGYDAARWVNWETPVLQ
jgi:hypothetical protein